MDGGQIQTKFKGKERVNKDIVRSGAKGCEIREKNRQIQRMIEMKKKVKF